MTSKYFESFAKSLLISATARIDNAVITFYAKDLVGRVSKLLLLLTSAIFYSFTKNKPRTRKMLMNIPKIADL